jgi:hypothetical protein
MRDIATDHEREMIGVVVSLILLTQNQAAGASDLSSSVHEAMERTATSVNYQIGMRYLASKDKRAQQGVGRLRRLEKNDELSAVEIMCQVEADTSITNPGETLDLVALRLGRNIGPIRAMDAVKRYRCKPVADAIHAALDLETFGRARTDKVPGKEADLVGLDRAASTRAAALAIYGSLYPERLFESGTGHKAFVNRWLIDVLDSAGTLGIKIPSLHGGGNG